MVAARMIPMIWLRLVVLIAFGIFVATQGMWMITAVAAVLALLSVRQLKTAYEAKRELDLDEA